MDSNGNPLPVLDYVSFIPKFAVQKQYAQDRPHPPGIHNWFPFDLKLCMMMVSQEDTELAISLSLVISFWTMFWAYIMPKNCHTLEPFHRNKIIISSDPNSDTGSIRNDAGNIPNARTVHSDATDRVVNQEPSHPSYLDQTPEPLRSQLASAIANIMT
jgi:hypothetical protein